MLIKNSEWADMMPVIKKRIDGTDVSDRGAFVFGECPEITVEAPRKLGASAVVLRIRADGKEDKDYPFSFVSTEGGIDFYSLTLDTVALCDGEEDGLFFYEILFLRGADTLFTTTKNNVDFTLSGYCERRFSMFVYQKNLKTPEWFKGNTMYQIFPDRFFKGEGAVGTRDDVIINEDWDNGVPQFAEKQGDPLKNNMFFGGNLWGITQKIEYLKSLGVGVIYLNPIFKAYSNHKYDTGDYLEIDSMFGGEAAFDELIKCAENAGMKVILDGVFNHTGDNSRYFDKYGEYGTNGAYSGKKSPYRKWYSFKDKKDDYESWWGIKILPRLNHECEPCRKFFTGDDGVGAHYIKKGIGGWRLDVADELSDKFLDEFCKAVKEQSNGEAIIIGEVWENAVEKEAYGKRRKYLRGKQLDSVMNYPLRSGILEYIVKQDSELLADTLKNIYSIYPKPVCDCLMNIIGTHDTERALTVFGKGTSEETRAAGSVLAAQRLSERQKELAIKKLMVAATVQYTVYGVPSLYYGDEAGLEGYRDPFCRMPYPWGRENKKLLDFYAKLGRIRKENSDIFARGDFKLIHSNNALLVYERSLEREKITVITNASKEKLDYKLKGQWKDLITGRAYDGVIGSFGRVILKKVRG